jgi:hypothetical protein
MSDMNPFRAPTVTDPVPRQRARSIGPVLAGIIAIALAGLLAGPGGLVVGILGVGSWWSYKFWPRRADPEDAGARAFLSRLETTPAAAADAVPPRREPAAEPGLDVLRDIQMDGAQEF